jgi:hypothetical protein
LKETRDRIKRELDKKEETKETTKSNEPIVSQDETGKNNTVRFPDGRVFFNISPKQVRGLVDAWNRRSGLPSGARFSDAPIALTEDEQILEDLRKQRRREELSAEQYPANVTEEQLAQLGQTNEAAVNFDYIQDPITKELFENYWRRREVNQSLFGNKMQWPRDEVTGKLLPPPLLNKATGLIPSSQIRRAVVDSISGDNEKIRNYLSDYSNEDTYEEILTQDEAANKMIESAKLFAAEYGYSNEAISLYNEGLQRKRIIQRQLKFISEGDQRRYVKDVRFKLTELETYFDVGQKDDIKQINDSLLSATPTMQATTGGVQLGGD